MVGDTELIDQVQIREKVETLWAKVFQASNRVLYQHGTFGFSGIELIPSPNIHQMLNTLRLLGFAIDILVEIAPSQNLDHDSIRQLLNAKQQIANMESVAAALKIGNVDDYEAAVAVLDKQMVV